VKQKKQGTNCVETQAGRLTDCLSFVREPTGKVLFTLLLSPDELSVVLFALFGFGLSNNGLNSGGCFLQEVES
jgi:hypothetical protein